MHAAAPLSCIDPHIHAHASEGQCTCACRSADGKQQDRLAAFFNFFLVNDNICAARGKDGGVAIWARISPVDDVKAGAML